MKKISQLIEIIGKFKDLKRSGWVNKKVNNPESDADHSFSLALLAMLFVPDELDKLKCLELALIHDLAEIYAGDYTPYDDISSDVKLQKEQDGMIRIANELKCLNLLELFDEYNNKKTKESIFINALDKIDNVITAVYYDKNNRSPELLTAEFAKYAKTKIGELKQDNLVSYLDEILNDIAQSSHN